MGRTVPSFRLALFDEEAGWRPFRRALGRADRKVFDRTFSVARLYVSACSYAGKPVRVHAVMMAIVFHHYRQLVRIAEAMEVR